MELYNVPWPSLRSEWAGREPYWSRAWASVSHPGLGVAVTRWQNEGSLPDPLWVAHWRGAEPQRAASLIKVGLVALLFLQAQRGELALEEKITCPWEGVVEGGPLALLGGGRSFSYRELAALSLSWSDNTAANLLLERLGLERVQDFMRRSLGTTSLQWRRYFMHSPLIEGENYLTPLDGVKLYLQLWQGDLLRGEYWQQFWSLLHGQQFREKLPALLPASLWSANKTGELDDGARHDLALFRGRRYTWIVAALSDQRRLAPGQIDQLWASLAWNLAAAWGELPEQAGAYWGAV